jgi:hypothetical protein
VISRNGAFRGKAEAQGERENTNLPRLILILIFKRIKLIVISAKEYFSSDNIISGSSFEDSRVSPG